MTDRSITARNEPNLSDERIRDTMRRQIDRAINVEREFTRASLANESGVNIHQIDAILTRDVAKHRRVAMADAFSIAQVLGDRAINALMALIGYSASPLEEPDAMHPMQITASALSDLSIIATAAADGRIDHTELPMCREAADHLIATMRPLSSAGGQ